MNKPQGDGDGGTPGPTTGDQTSPVTAEPWSDTTVYESGSAARIGGI